MNTKSKIAAALAVVTLASSLAIPSSEAQAKGKHWGIGAAIVGSAFVGAAIADGAIYGGYYEPGYRSCRFERQYDSYGFYVGSARVCRYYD